MKEVYVLKHTHVESNPNIAGSRVKPTTLHILNLTYKLGLDIGVRKQASSLFADGHDEELVAREEQYLAEIRRHEGVVSNFLKTGMSDMLRQGHLGEFQWMWHMLLYGSLQEEGVNVSLKPTDISFRNFREIGIALFTQWCMETGTDPHSVTPEQWETEIRPREIRYRDEYIHQKIKDTGTDRNLLVIGAAHPLESLLADTNFRTYVVEVEHWDGSTYRIEGTLPKDLMGITDRIQDSTYDLSPFLLLGDTAKLETRLEYV